MSIVRKIAHNPHNHSGAVYELKQLLVSSGYWTVVSSGDGIGGNYSSSGDIITGDQYGPFGTNYDKAWMRFQGTGGQEWTIQRDVGANDRNWRVKYSPSAGFTGGSPGALQTPSATDEVLLAGGGTDASPTFGVIRQTTGAFALTYNMVCDTESGSFLCYGHTTNPWTDGVMMIDFVETVLGTDDNGVFYFPNFASPNNPLRHVGNVGFSAVTSTAAGPTAILSAGTPTLVTVAASTLAAVSSSGAFNAHVGGQGIPPALDGKELLAPVFYTRTNEAGPAPPQGYKGRSKLLRWFMRPQVFNQTLYTDVANIAAPEWIAASDHIAVRWDGPAAATNEEAEDLGVGGAPAADIVPPTVSNFLPASGSIGKQTAIGFDVTDLAPGLKDVIVTLKYANSEDKLVVYAEGAFQGQFASAESAKTAITNGFHFDILPNGGWTSDIDEIFVHAYDAAGNQEGVP